MEWNDKVQMIQLGNAINDSDGGKLTFQNYVVEHIETFDNQAWDMFSNIVEIIPAEMKNDSDFWKNVYPRLAKVEPNFGLRTSMRLEMLKLICEKELECAGENIENFPPTEKSDD